MTDLRGDINIPLRKWIEDDARRKALDQHTVGADNDIFLLLSKQSLLRRTTVAFGILDLLRQSRDISSDQRLTPATVAIDNFIVHTPRREQTPSWNDVMGVSMIWPTLSAQIIEPSFLAIIDDESNPHGSLGRFLEVDIFLPRNITNIDAGKSSDSESNDCHLFGILLYELFSGMCPFPAAVSNDVYLGSRTQAMSMNDNSHSEPTKKKKSTVRYDKKKGKSYSTLQPKPYAPLQELGFPSSICMLATNLIDDHGAYSSLDAARSDIHLLLRDPNCFLDELGDSAKQGGCVQLRIREGKLYGREKEVSLITEAFCRVSSGKNEAIFIGGYSGSGKTMLVNSLRSRVDIAGGGYVLTQKADQMSKQSPLLDVLSAFNSLCVLIKEKSTPQELLVMSNKVTNEFESDFSVLARLVPNINVLFPQLAQPQNKDANMEQMMNLQNVSFTLQRFMGIVSSKQKPVMLFLDDLQWAGVSSLKLIQALLSDTRGSSCFFFVGNYRDNEIEQEHPIFDLMSNLELTGVTLTKIKLCGLKQDDLNLMISESLCIFPQLCKSLSNIVFEKTMGSPYFALQFLRSLVDSRLLKYSLRERRWIWDEKKICSENITDNVLFLLTAKMTSLPERTQKALKVCSCFGIKADDSIIDYLTSTPEYAEFRDWLSQAIDEGCMQKDGSQFKFVHDKVMEAAYSLIPDKDRNQFHYNLGMLLHSASKGQVLGGEIFQVVDQINRGIPDLIQPDTKMEIAELNFRAGSRAAEFSDYATAQSYLNNALALLPDNHWSSQYYDFSLRLYFLRAKVAYSCGDIIMASDLLKKLLAKGRCIENKLHSYYLYATILHACEERDEAYTMCQEVLTQLGETIPESVDMRQVGAMINETVSLLGTVSNDVWLVMKEMDAKHRITLKFYSLLQTIVHFSKPEKVPHIGSRMIRLSLEHGVCQDSAVGLSMYAAIICQQCKLVPEMREAWRIGNVAMWILKRYSSEKVPLLYSCHYGLVAVNFEPLQLCADGLRKGFEVGLSAGESAHAFYNSMRLISISLLAGDNLSALLKTTDYHLEMMTRFSNKLSLPSLSSCRETISTLIDKGGSTSAQSKNPAMLEETESNPAYIQRHNKPLLLNYVLRSFWLGHAERCHHYAKKALDESEFPPFYRRIILFYAALNAFRGIRNRNGAGSEFMKIKPLYKDAIAALKDAAELSRWNFSNKVHLLEAELSSFEGKDQEAKSSYAAAITSSRSSKFIHEHGLACELAGLHYKKAGQAEAALHFLQVAKESYTQWGSEMKVEAITQLMDRIRPTSKMPAK